MTANEVVTLLTVPQIAAFLNVSESHVFRLIASGQLSVVDVSQEGSPPKNRVRTDVLAAFIDERSGL